MCPRPPSQTEAAPDCWLHCPQHDLPPLWTEGAVPVIICHQHLLQAWTNIVEVRPDLVRSLEVSWRSDCGPLCHLGLERFFTCLAASRLTQISLSLNFCPLLSQTEPADQLRYAGHLLGLLTTSLHSLTVKVEVEREGEGEDINVFPLLDALAQQVKVSTSLTRLEVEVEMNSSQLSCPQSQQTKYLFLLSDHREDQHDGKSQRVSAQNLIGGMLVGIIILATTRLLL